MMKKIIIIKFNNSKINNRKKKIVKRIRKIMRKIHLSKINQEIKVIKMIIKKVKIVVLIEKIPDQHLKIVLIQLILAQKEKRKEDGDLKKEVVQNLNPDQDQNLKKKL